MRALRNSRLDADKVSQARSDPCPRSLVTQVARTRFRIASPSRPPIYCCLLSWQSAISAAFVLVCVPLSLGQPYLTDPIRFWRHESDYAGSEACKSCHWEIYERQLDSNHAASLRPTSEVPQLTEGLPVSRSDRASASTLTLDSDAPYGIRLRAEMDSQTSEATLQWAFGSGLKGITPVGQTLGGDWVESRLTWYESLQDIAFTTGASQYDPRNALESLGRTLTREEVAECFGCHTTGYDPDRLAPARGEMGIHCERCHGPGLEHAKSAAQGLPPRTAIFNPGSLEGFPQAQMCGACHGRPPQDNDFDALRLLEQTPHSVRFPSQRIVLSRCFNETFGELACTDCHDPHGNVADEGGRLDAACLSCHDRKARQHAAVCTVGSADCSSCHMPKERVMRHSMFSDHWIRVVRANE